MKKKILVFTPHFFPENQIINDLVFSLKHKYDFLVVSSFPHYPKRSLFKSYSYFRNTIQTVNGVKIIRLPLTPRVGKNLFFLTLNYFSYVILSLILLPYLLIIKFDRIFIYQTSPVTIALTPILLSKIKKIKSSIWILDLWPETIETYKFPLKKMTNKILNTFCKFIYDSNEKILISSNNYLESLQKKDINPEKISFIPQWLNINFDETIKNKLQFPNIPSNSFVITFAGNIGAAQDIESILETISALKNIKKIYWIFIGDGSHINLIQNYIKINNSRNVFLLGHMPSNSLNFYFKKSNALLISLKSSAAFDKVLPAKIIHYMTAGIPILTMANGAISNFVDSLDIGLCAKSGDYKQLSNNIQRTVNFDQNKLEINKNNCKTGLDDYFNKDKILKKIINLCFE